MEPTDSLEERVGGTEVAAPFALRYDDVTQDGRVSLHALPNVLGAVTWPAVDADPRARELRADGVVPILVRMLIRATEARISPLLPVRGAGRWRAWTARAPDGSVDRIGLTMVVEVYGRTGHALLPRDPDAPEVLVGTVLADHVFTRPFEPPPRRRVTDLAGRVPEEQGELRRFEAVGADGAAMALPDAPIAFGLVHTDGNQHVNSIAYLRQFEDAAVRSEPSRALARWCEIAWRKPFFAGDRATIRRWAIPGGLGGAFVDRDGAERCRIALGGDP